MSGGQAVPHASRRGTPQIAASLSDEPNPFDDDDVPGRKPERAPERMFTAPEPHEKYHLYPDEIPDDMDACWLPTRIAGQVNEKIGNFYRAGWMPAKAKDFPRVSGFGVEYPEEMIEAGLLENAKPNSPIIIDDQMLVLRSKELSRRANRQRNRDAVDQVENQFRRLKQASRSFRGTELKRGQHAPLPDSARYADEE